MQTDLSWEIVFQGKNINAVVQIFLHMLLRISSDPIKTSVKLNQEKIQISASK